MRPSLSIIIPCYNEAKNIPLLVSRFIEARPAGLMAELVLVDNGSNDGTSLLLRTIARKQPFVRPVRIRTNTGYGSGVWTGLQAARGEFIGWTHADLQTDVKDVFTAYSLISSRHDQRRVFVKGRRQGRPLLDRFFTAGMGVYETLMLGMQLSDINAQPNFFHRSFLDICTDPPDDFSFDLYCYALAKIRGYKVVRFSVAFGERRHGVSHWNNGFADKWKFIKRTMDFTRGLPRRLRQH